MAQETKVEETLCSLQTFERNRYFYGKPMTVSDFEAEQRYLVGKHRYINRLVHGAGVLCGLQVTTPAGFDAERPTVEVAEGAALDCCGNLIIVSRSSTVKIKGDFNPEAVNYLFIKYAECSKHPVLLAANGSSCEEVCCYNRIQETFEIVATTTAPGGGEAAPAAAAPSKPAAKDAGPAPDAETVCRGLTEKYYQENLKTCSGCDDPLVFLAVLDPEKGEVDEEETARYRSVVFNNSMLHGLLCGHVTDYNNPHRTSAEQVRALQSVNGVGNSPTRSFVANIDLRSGDNTIGITPDKNAKKIELVLGANAVRLSHLNEDVINHLLLSSQTVTVESNVGAKTITLHTTPAKSVTSVGRAPVVGASGSYAPEDHAHDLSEGVVGREHLAEDVYANLVRGGGIIKVESDAAARTISVSAEVAPGDDLRLLSSVTGKKRLGRSERYAREDHAHDLRINERSPNESGDFRLTPGANVRIDKGEAENELVISAEGGGRAAVATGVFTFENVLPQDVRTSDLITHGLDSETVAVILAEEMAVSPRVVFALNVDPVKNVARFGDTAAFFAEAPSLMAEADYGQKTLRISLRDRRQRQPFESAGKLAAESEFRSAPTETAATREETDLSDTIDPSGFIAPTGAIPPPEPGEIIFNPDARNYRVRWWVIPA
ncbi:MAG TPA: hypothetical protein VF591_04410 [Pyrinomonadaceae bacterium]|jgi:hypothetical protein